MPEDKMGVRKGNLSTPTDLSMVLSLGTQAEKEGTQAQSSETNHLINPITMPEGTRPTENETGWDDHLCKIRKHRNQP